MIRRLVPVIVLKRNVPLPLLFGTLLHALASVTTHWYVLQADLHGIQSHAHASASNHLSIHLTYLIGTQKLVLGLAFKFSAPKTNLIGILLIACVIVKRWSNVNRIMIGTRNPVHANA